MKMMIPVSKLSNVCQNWFIGQLLRCSVFRFYWVESFGMFNKLFQNDCCDSKIIFLKINKLPV